MQPPPRLDLGNPQQPQQVPPHFPPPPYREEQAAAAPKQSGVARVLPTLVTLGAFAGLAVLAWFAYQEGQVPVSDEDIPVIKAEEEPFKRVPENPGGEQIPHADKEVYNSITGDKPQAEAKPEVVEDADRPIDRSFLKQFAGTGEDETADQVKQESVTFGQEKKPAAKEEVMLEPKPLPLAKANETLPTPNTGGVEVVKKMEAAVPASEPVKPAVETPKAEAKAPAKAESKPEVKKEVVKKPTAAPKETVVKPAPKKPAAAAVSGTRVQLGAYRSEKEAGSEWKKIQSKNKTALAGLSMVVQKVEIPDKGTMYRLQAGPVASKDAARALCKKLVAAGQGCFVAK